VAGGLGLAIRLRFHKYAPEQLTRGLAFHQQAADQLRGHHLSRTPEEAVREGWDGDGA